MASSLTIIATMTSMAPKGPVFAARPSATEGGCRSDRFGCTDEPLSVAGASYATSHTRGGNGHSYGGASAYGYDNNGQLTSSSLESLTYGYDAGWNMTSRNTTSYTVNDRNQVTGDGAVSYTYDANGNRTSSSSYRSWTWDDENQLIGVEQYQSWKSEFTYDGRQRLRVRKEFTWNAGYGAWQLSSETRYVYDGMLLLQERNSGNVPQISYGRGLDLSGTLAGAGGIGGLLARYRHATTSPYAINGASFYHADGNGNVTYLAGTSGAADAAYRYDPFGRWLAETGSYAAANVMRFSSKPWIAHNGSSTDGLYYYGYRFYDPPTQRWLNRDPIHGRSGINLYRFVLNRSTGAVDIFGLQALPPELLRPPVVRALVVIGVPPIACAIVVGLLCACAIDAASCVIWPAPSPDPLPLPPHKLKPPHKPKLNPNPQSTRKFFNPDCDEHWKDYQECIDEALDRIEQLEELGFPTDENDYWNFINECMRNRNYVTPIQPHPGTN